MGLFRQWLAEARLPIRGDYQLIPGFKFGIEIEGFVKKGKWVDVAQDLGEYKSLDVIGDCSLRIRSNKERGIYDAEGMEVRTSRPVGTEEIPDVLEDLKVLEKHGFYMNKSSGIHIHVSHQSFEDKSLYNIPLSFLLNVISLFDEPELLANLKHRRDHFFAASIRDELARLLSDPHVRENPTLIRGAIANFGRYSSVNFLSLTKHGSVEFRLFGTLGLLRIDRDVAPYINYLAHLLQKAIDNPYKMGKFKVVGDEIFIDGKPLPKKSREKTEELEKEYEHAIGYLIQNYTEPLEDTRSDSAKEMSPGPRKLTADGLKILNNFIGSSRAKLQLAIRKIMYSNNAWVQLDKEEEKRAFEDLLDLFLKSKELLLLQDFVRNSGNRDDTKEVILDWAGKNRGQAKELIRFVNKSLTPHRSLSGPSRWILEGLLEGDDPLSNTALKELSKLISLKLEKGSSLGPWSDWLEKMIYEFKKAGRDRDFKEWQSKLHKTKYGYFFDPLKEKEKRLKEKG